MAFITPEDVRRHLDAWGFGSTSDKGLAEHLAGDLAMVAQSRTNEGLQAIPKLKLMLMAAGVSEALVDAVIAEGE